MPEKEEKSRSGRKAKATSKNIETWKKLRSEGYSIKEIANTSGFGTSTISHYTKGVVKKRSVGTAERLAGLDDGIKELNRGQEEVLGTIKGIQDRQASLDDTIKEIKDRQERLNERIPEMQRMLKRVLEGRDMLVQWLIPVILGLELVIMIVVLI